MSLQVVWLVTWLSVVVLNVDLGLAIGVVFSMMTLICRTQRYTEQSPPRMEKSNIVHTSLRVS